MALDPILSEVRRIRKEYVQQFNGDLRAMMTICGGDMPNRIDNR